MDENDLMVCSICGMLPEDCDCEDEECPDCGGRGEFMDCCDDLCHAQGYCIHGDSHVCPTCRQNG